jgi:hypothetical protein
MPLLTLTIWDLKGRGAAVDPTQSVVQRGDARAEREEKASAGVSRYRDALAFRRRDRTVHHS